MAAPAFKPRTHFHAGKFGKCADASGLFGWNLIKASGSSLRTDLRDAF
jgi:hypothetical protein